MREKNYFIKVKLDSFIFGITKIQSPKMATKLVGQGERGRRNYQSTSNPSHVPF